VRIRRNKNSWKKWIMKGCFCLFFFCFEQRTVNPILFSRIQPRTAWTTQLPTYVPEKISWEKRCMCVHSTWSWHQTDYHAKINRVHASSQEPIPRMLNLQLQHWRCGKLECLQSRKQFSSETHYIGYSCCKLYDFEALTLYLTRRIDSRAKSFLRTQNANKK
jgi:hypothetical protein